MGLLTKLMSSTSLNLPSLVLRRRVVLLLQTKSYHKAGATPGDTGVPVAILKVMLVQ